MSVVSPAAASPQDSSAFERERVFSYKLLLRTSAMLVGRLESLLRTAQMNHPID